MRSSTDKHRDMARSILPSKARSTTDQLVRTRRVGRRSISRELALLARHAPVPNDTWDEDTDLRAYPDIEIREIVRWRRAADKLNHFERWAIEVTKALPLEDRLGHLRAVLPKGLVGEHAMSHLEWRPELNPRHPDWRAPRREYLRAREAGERDRRLLLCRLLEGLLQVPGGHKALNTAMKAVPAGDDDTVRILAGVHDIEAFVTDVLADQHGYLLRPRWYRAVRETVTEILDVTIEERV